MNGNQGVLVGAILPLVHCYSSNWHLMFFFFSSSATEGSSERPGKVDNYLMSSISKAATPKVCRDLGEWPYLEPLAESTKGGLRSAHQQPFGSLKNPILR